MQGPAKTTNRLDGLDIEAFEKMLASASFGLLKDRITAELERAKLELETRNEEAEIRRLQGSIRAFRTVLGLSNQLLGEMKHKQ